MPGKGASRRTKELSSKHGFKMEIGAQTTSGGSAAILWADGIEADKTDVMAGGRVAYARLLLPSGPQVFASVYGPSGGTSASVDKKVEKLVNKAIASIVTEAEVRKDGVVILGDLNSIADTMTEWGLVQHAETIVLRITFSTQLTSWTALDY